MIIVGGEAGCDEADREEGGNDDAVIDHDVAL